ncbi:MAG: type transport system permease protein [Thermoplasmata archaeon]|jgi:ABC-2 type transport system permease protein|nr:type transport system permease protein [Thermoplasmata archaeon]
MSDVGTVVWKEWREHFLRRGRPSRTVVAALVMVALFGLIAPIAVIVITSRFLPIGAVVSALATAGLFAAAFQGLVVTSSLIIDAFAGERERHTLETLLAGPLPDRAILVGKILAIQLFVAASAFLEVLVQQTVGLVLLGLPAFGYAPILLAGPILAVLVGLLVGGAGAIVGMRVATVKNGQQIMAYLLIPFYLLPSFGGMLLTQTPAGRAIVRYQDAVGPVLFLLTIMAVLAAADALLLLAARRAFRRDRLLLRK